MVVAHVSSETTPLVAKRGDGSVATYGQQTFETASTGASYEYCQTRLPEYPPDEPVLGSVVIFETQGVDTCPPNGRLTTQEQVTEEPPQQVADVVDDIHVSASIVLAEEVNGDTGHFQMGMTRNLSILPSDVAHAATFSTSPVEPDDMETASLQDKTAPVISKKRPWFAYALLLIAMISLSSIGPLLKLQQDATPTMKIQWRMFGTAVLLVPFTAAEIVRDGVPRLTKPQVVTFWMSTVCYDVFSLCFIMALDYTSVGNAVILSNSLALILLVGKVCTGNHVSFAEGSGALVAFAGCVLCSKDSGNGRAEGSAAGITGDLLAIVSAIGGVGYLVCAKSSRQHIPLYTFMFSTMLAGCLLIAPFQVWVLGEELTFDMDPNHGFWGFLLVRSDRLPLEIVMIVVCNLFGTMGYVHVMQYFDNLVISTAALMEPVAAEFLAFILGVGTLPGIHGWLGNILVAGGTFTVVYAGNVEPSEGPVKDVSVQDPPSL